MNRRPAYGIRMSCFYGYIFMFFFVFGVAALGWIARQGYTDWCSLQNMHHAERMLQIQVDGQLEIMKFRYEHPTDPAPSLKTIIIPNSMPDSDCIIENDDGTLPEPKPMPNPCRIANDKPDCGPKG